MSPLFVIWPINQARAVFVRLTAPPARFPLKLVKISRPRKFAEKISPFSLTRGVLWRDICTHLRTSAVATRTVVAGRSGRLWAGVDQEDEDGSAGRFLPLRSAQDQSHPCRSVCCTTHLRPVIGAEMFFVNAQGQRSWISKRTCTVKKHRS